MTGIIKVYRGEKEILVTQGEDIIVRACCRPVRAISLLSANLGTEAGALVRVWGRVDRVYRRTVRLHVGDRDIYVYAPAASTVDIRTLPVGTWWEVTGVVSRGPSGWEIIVRGKEDLRRLFLFFALPERLVHFLASFLGGDCLWWGLWPARSGLCLL